MVKTEFVHRAKKNERSLLNNKLLKATKIT